MKVVLLAGGFGTRISEESGIRPKPMVEIGEKPILWHIMKIFSHYGLDEFIICCGHKGNIIKDYFANYYLHESDVTFDMKKNVMDVHRNNAEPWKVTLVDTGISTMTGGRLKRVAEYLQGETFCMTYGDGVTNQDLLETIDFHKKQGKLATLTAVQEPGRFGAFNLSGEDKLIRRFAEKPDPTEEKSSAWINGGFFVLEPEVINYIDDDTTIFERSPLETLARSEQLSAFKHYGYWQSMDTLRDKNHLERLWNEDKAPWKLWKD